MKSAKQAAKTSWLHRCAQAIGRLRLSTLQPDSPLAYTRPIPLLENLEQRCMLDATFHGGTWFIKGDEGGTATDDAIVVEHDAVDPTVLNVVINDVIADTQPAHQVRRIRVSAGDGDDIVRLDIEPRTDRRDVRAVMYGGDGDDQLIGGPGRDILYGGNGNDILNGRGGNDRIFGQGGDDQIDGGDGRDLIRGGWGRDVVEGGEGRDNIAGQHGSDWLDGGADNDRIHGGFGPDTIEGGLGNDWIYGSGDADRLDGGDGNDYIIGGNGDDTIRGGKGRNRLAGGRGADRLYTMDNQQDRFRALRDDIEIQDVGDGPLVQIGSATGLGQWLRNAALEEFHSQATVRSFGGPQFRTFVDPLQPEIAFDGGPVFALADSAMADAPVADASTDFENTLNQVDGVDEADLVKTDGEFVYLISDNELIIVDALPADTANIISRTNINGGYGSALYLHGDKLTVVSETNYYFVQPFIDIAIADASFAPRTTPETLITVYDVSDPTAPTQIEETRIEGSLSDSRMIDGRIYGVVRNFFNFPMPIVQWNWRTNEYDHEDEATYIERMENFDLTTLFPTYSVTDGNGVEIASGQIVTPPDLFVPTIDRIAPDMLSVVMLDLNDGADPGVVSSTSVLGVSGEVYASADSLYIASSTRPWWWDDGGMASKLYKFDLGPDEVTLAATGEFTGRILNQFSMDESNGYFRVATTTGWGRHSSNHVFVMEQQGDALEVVGSIRDIGKTEQIHSVRFMGDRGYVVTFRQIDPLFTLDLSIPESPEVVGELKIPGFSSFLQPYGPDHLIGIGRDANPDTGVALGLQLSLFDITDFANPVLEDTYRFSEERWGAYSEAQNDHKAFSLFQSHGILAIPVDEGVWWNDGPAGLQVFHVDTETGFDLLGNIDHRSDVRRSIRIDQLIYSISRTDVKINTINDPDTEHAAIEIREPIDEPIWLF